jgi:inhibitor of cysteine peptidase
MRNFALCLTCATALLLAVPPVCAQDALRLAPGESRSVTFAENPSTGYTWAIDTAASQGLAIIAIVDGGHRRGATMPGAPGTRSWTFRALKPGHADIVFAYRRPWEQTPVETRHVVVDVAP